MQGEETAMRSLQQSLNIRISTPIPVLLIGCEIKLILETLPRKYARRSSSESVAIKISRWDDRMQF